MAPLVELNETGILGHTRDNPKFVVLDSQPAEYHWAGLVTRYYKRNRPNLLIRVSRVYFVFGLWQKSMEGENDCWIYRRQRLYSSAKMWPPEYEHVV